MFANTVTVNEFEVPDTVESEPDAAPPLIDSVTEFANADEESPPAASSVANATDGRFRKLDMVFIAPR